MDYQDEKTNFCYIQGCSKCYTTRKALNLHVRNYHKPTDLHKDASEYLTLQKTNPKTYLKNYNTKRVLLTKIFKQETLSKRLSSINQMVEDNNNAVMKSKISRKAAKKCNDLMNTENFLIGEEIPIRGHEKESTKEFVINKKKLISQKVDETEIINKDFLVSPKESSLIGNLGPFKALSRKEGGKGFSKKTPCLKRPDEQSYEYFYLNLKWTKDYSPKPTKCSSKKKDTENIKNTRYHNESEIYISDDSHTK